jgi:hypothetical protein
MKGSHVAYDRMGAGEDASEGRVGEMIVALPSLMITKSN